MVDESCAPRGARLRWAIHRSFDEYLRTRTSDGIVELRGGVTRDDTGEFLFPVDARRSTADRLVVEGTVEYRAYLGVLTVRIAQLEVERGDGGWAVSIAEPRGIPGERLVIAIASDEASAPDAHLDLRPRLTQDGADLFLGRYEVDSDLAPIAFEPAAEAADV